MLIQIADAFTPEEAAEIRRRLDAAEWVDGKVTAGYQSAEVKRNRQLPEQHPLAQELGNLILQRLSANNLFMSDQGQTMLIQIADVSRPRRPPRFAAAWTRPSGWTAR